MKLLGKIHLIIIITEQSVNFQFLYLYIYIT